MFWFFPFLQGRDLDYREYFALIFALIALAVSFLFWFLALLCFYLQSKPQSAFPAYLPFFLPASPCLYQVSAFLSSLALAVAVTVLSMFDFLSVLVTIPLVTVILARRFWQWCKDCANPHQSQVSDAIRTLAVVERTRPGLFYALLVASVTVAVGLPLVTQGFCLCYYNAGMGVVSGSAGLSTTLSRMLTMPTSCPEGPPCHVYATLPEDSAHFVFINAHTSPRYDSLTIRYGLSPSSLDASQPMTQFPVSGLETQTNRHVFSVLLSNLKSDMQYFLQIQYDSSSFSGLYWFRTLPESLSTTPLRFVAGGDMGNNAFSYTISARAGEQNPLVGFVGGDLAYDNNFRACARTWDLLLSQWSDYMSADKQQLVPLVFGLGNHDVGLESLSGKTLELGPSGPLFFIFFPQHFARDANGRVLYEIPQVADRKSYFRHTLGPASFYTLDSGYIANYTGTQLRWLEAELQADSAKLKFAQYHLPVYPSIPLDPDEKDPSGQALKYWVPLFDEYRFAVVFENHVHSFKRTVPLACSLEDPTGVVYTGDGQWGAGSQTTPNPGFDTDPEIFLKEGLHFHVWVVDVFNSSAALTAIGLNPGDIVDSFQVEV